MNYIKKNKATRFLLIAAFSLSISIPVVQVFAQGDQVSSPAPTQQTISDSSASKFGITNPLHANSIGEIVLDFVQIFGYIAVLCGVLAIIWVGFQYILASAQGNGEKIKDLHGYFLSIVIGLAIVIGATTIIHVIINTLKASGTVSPSIINSAEKAVPK